MLLQFICKGDLGNLYKSGLVCKILKFSLFFCQFQQVCGRYDSLSDDRECNGAAIYWPSYFPSGQCHTSKWKPSLIGSLCHVIKVISYSYHVTHPCPLCHVTWPYASCDLPYHPTINDGLCSENRYSILSASCDCLWCIGCLGCGRHCDMELNGLTHPFTASEINTSPLLETI